MTNISEIDIPQISINNMKKLITGISTDITTAGTQALMLWGSPGIGKSDLVRQLAEDLDRIFVDVRLSTIDPVDLRGLPMINVEEQLTNWLPPSFLPNVQSEPGILFLDEINAAPPMLQASAYQLILDRKLGEYQIPEDWLVIAAGNKLSDRSVTHRMPSALSNRFSHFEIIVSKEEWFQWAWQNNIDPFIISFLRFHPQLLFDFNPQNNKLAFPTPRSWSFASVYRPIRDENPDLYFKGVQSCVGYSATKQLMAFSKNKDMLIDPEIILSGKDYSLPNDPGVHYVMMGALIQSLLSNLSSDRITNYFEYANSFENTSFSDYGVVIVKELINALINDNPLANNENGMTILQKNSSYKSWLNKHSKLLMEINSQ